MRRYWDNNSQLGHSIMFHGSHICLNITHYCCCRERKIVLLNCAYHSVNHLLTSVTWNTFHSHISFHKLATYWIGSNEHAWFMVMLLDNMPHFFQSEHVRKTLQLYCRTKVMWCNITKRQKTSEYGPVNYNHRFSSTELEKEKETSCMSSWSTSHSI